MSKLAHPLSPLRYRAFHPEKTPTASLTWTIPGERSRDIAFDGNVSIVAQVTPAAKVFSAWGSLCLATLQPASGRQNRNSPVPLGSRHLLLDAPIAKYIAAEPFSSLQ